MKKIAIIGTAGVPSRYGGFETLAHQLVEHLGSRFSISVYGSRKYYPKGERPRSWKGARMYYLPLNANGIQSIPYDILSMIHAIFYADVLVILGVSGGIMIPFLRFFTGRKIVVNMDGAEWKRQKWNGLARLYLKISERMAVKYAHQVIADNEVIKQNADASYRIDSRLIEYGANHASPNKLSKEIVSKYPFLALPYAFKVARIEPENNVHMILKTFSELPNKNLVIIGNWKKSEYGLQLLDRYSKYSNIHLLDPIYDQAILDSIRSNCFIYLHGHSAGGTNPSLVEAMFLGLPVIAYGVNYNRATTENMADYFMDEHELKQLILNKRMKDFSSNRKNMQDIANRRYTWKIIAEKYQELILGLYPETVSSPVSHRFDTMATYKAETAKAPLVK